MVLLLLALLQASAPPEDTKATLQSCEMLEKRWVCHYQVPSGTIVAPVDLAPAAVPPPAPVVAPPVDLAPPKASNERNFSDHSSDDRNEASRQTRLIARCANAKWYSPCLPGEREEARVLRDAAISAATLRGKVTTLLSEQRCDEAVKTALAGGDLPLAREAREFCATSH